METVEKTTEQLTTKSLFAREDVRKKFEEMLGKKAQGFMTSVLQIAASNKQLANADPMSIYNAAATAATLDLPLNNNLGFAYIIGYNQKQEDGQFKQVAQFQMGYKGFIQLAQRSGQFKTISATPIYEGQLVESNPLTGFKFDFSQKKNESIIGFAAYFSLVNGFEKTLYMGMDEMKAHGLRFSKTYKFGLWQTDLIGMGTKTVLKLLLSKFAPLSIEMQKAVIVDQSVINNAETEDVSYVDHDEPVIDKIAERVVIMIEEAQTIVELEALKSKVGEEQLPLYKEKLKALNKNGSK